MNYADANRRRTVKIEDPRAPQRVPDTNPPSASRSEGETSSKNGPEREIQATRLDAWMARVAEAAQRVAAQQAERQANGEYAARMEVGSQAQAEAGREGGIRLRGRRD
jgi:hypothetical protein